jgi:mRNA deadenylase 3'-5' endonuclease subunit Ccr4
MKEIFFGVFLPLSYASLLLQSLTIMFVPTREDELAWQQRHDVLMQEFSE